MSKKTYVVQVELPYGSDEDEMGEYIEEAIKGWCGGLNPEDPLFSLNRKSVLVQWVSKEIVKILTFNLKKETDEV